ncbi:putative disease resistance protein RGA1 [Vicia villosa]|uniref:putative disease resistance protein RGA1 n=1 Tax=Vicia villosa TaxID=3911 RepID=UPI00273BC63A|nr:putative disease resistance protein RGA1 [Vicia villosa]
MAEQVPYGVAESLINRLASAAFREFGRIYGVMDELERLKNTVELIKAVLLDAEDKQQQNHAIQIWIRRLKDGVLHPTDDLLDEFLIHDLKHKTDESHNNTMTKVLHSLSPSKIAFRGRMARGIEKIQKKFNDIVKDMTALNLNPNVVGAEQSCNEKRETSSFVLESDIVGREDDKNNIINLLRQPRSNQNVFVVAIVGIGGLGKTALAQLVYNDAEVKDIFEKRMWLCVSDNFDVKTILKKMLESLTKGNIDDMLSLEELQNMLHDNLTGKKYLLVLDDIWNESFEKWAQLRTYLMCGAQDSKVVVTTRSKIVAQTMGVSVPYTLNGLNPIESWSLLKKIITFGDENKGVNQILEPIGMEIAEKCRGVPLAIRTVGGLLQGKSEKKEWITVLQGDFWKLCEDEESIMPVLKISYQNLSPQLRQCFSCCSLYPKDWQIEKNELIQLWMAQGYLEFSDEKQAMEDIGDQFINIFFMKSFFQDARFDGDDKLCRFKMHDLMHDIAMQVAGNDCCYLDSETKRLVGCPMHVMLESDAIGLLESVDASRVRTLIFNNSFLGNGSEKELVLISKFKYLRFLKLLNCSIIKLCDLIGNLKHLRFLKLQHCEGVEGIFKSISSIVCLQTFILTGSQVFEFSIKDFLSVINLRYLYIENLKVFQEKKKTTRGFGKLSLGERYKCLTFSKWLSSLTNIVYVSLYYCKGVHYLSPMERLPFLKSLIIGGLDELEYIYFEEPFLSEEFFASMENLEIINCVNLKGWRRIRDDIIYDDNSSQSCHLSFLPCLSSLTIIQCPMLTHMPTFPNLDKKLVFWDCNMDPLEATLNTVKSNSSIVFPPLSMLEHLELSVPELDVKSFPDNWMQNLTSLKHLKFYNLGYQAFQEIEFWFKDRLNYLPSLQKIVIFDCWLREFPVWICNLSSLQHVSIRSCSLLTSLPDEMRRLANLQTLEIIYCPSLIEECQTETSATWANIAHIPNIFLYSY